MEEEQVQYLTGNRIGDGFLGVVAAHIALTAFWWAGFGLLLVTLPLFVKDVVNAQVISGLFAAPSISWILTMLLVRPIKRKYRTLGRAYQATGIVYGVIYFGGLGVCLAIMTVFK